MYIIRNSKNEDITQISALLNQLGYIKNLEQFTQNYQNYLKFGIYHCFVAEKAAKITRKEVIAKEKNCSSVLLISNMQREKNFHEFYLHQGYNNQGNSAQLY